MKQKILNLLAGTKFSADEIIAVIVDEQRDASVEEISCALFDLLAEGKIGADEEYMFFLEDEYDA